jgi:hypothetical protein
MANVGITSVEGEASYPLLSEAAARGAELEQEIDERVAELYGA